MIVKEMQHKIIPYRKGSLYGYCDSSKNIVIDCVYEKATPFLAGIANVKINGKWKGINKNGKIIFETKNYYDRILPFDELLGVVRDGKIGLIDYAGNEIVPCIYTIYFTSLTKHSISIVCKNNQFGFLDSNFKVLIPCIYRKAKNFSNGLAAVSNGKKWGFINSIGEVVIALEFDNAESFGDSELAFVEKNGKWGAIDKQGKVEVNFEYEYETDVFHSFSEGLLAVRKNGKWGYLNTHFKEQIPCTLAYYSVSDFSDGLALVTKNGSYGFIDTNGLFVIDCGSSYEEVGSFIGGYAVAKKNGKYGIINKEAQPIVPFKFENSKILGSEYFEVGLRGKYGVVNLNGPVIPCIYDEIIYFNERISCVKLNNKFGCVDSRGNVVIPIIYEELLVFDENGLAPLKLGYIDIHGNEYWE